MLRTLGPSGIAAGLLSAILISQTPAAAQAPARDQPSAPAVTTGTSRLRGRVVGEDGAPIRRAQVRARAAALRLTRIASTDAEGRYEFGNLPAARYTLTVNKAGYVPLEFGQKRPFDGGRPMDLAEGQTADRIDFALPRGGVITGRILDNAGEPVAGASVSAMRYRFIPGGRRRLEAVSSSFLGNQTNDLGEFRLYGLMPGTYIVSARASATGVIAVTPDSANAASTAAVDLPDGYLTTYFPGTVNPAEAEPVAVALAEEAQASFSMLIARMSNVSGFVRTSDGRPNTAVRLFLRPRDFGSVSGSSGSAPIRPDGTFHVANVPPGEYVLEATPVAAGGEFAETVFTVAGRDVTNLIVITSPGVSASGRIVIAGQRPRSTDGSRITMTATPDDPGRRFYTSLAALDSRAVDASGNFRLRGLSGRVLFRPNVTGSNLVLKSVTLNGTDITDTPIDVTNTDLTGLEIVLVEQGRLSGTARSARGSVKDFKVALFPANLRPGALPTRYTVTASSDPDGRFQITRLPPGEYFGAAVESLELGGEWDPAFHKSIIGRAARFTIREGQMLTIELPFLD
jgi:hypothetical protein